MGIELSLLGALLLGFLGSPHCAGMCGGIGTALANSLPGSAQRSVIESIGYTSAYNLGRIASYMLAGVIASLVGAGLLDLVGHARAHTLMAIVSGLVFIALGLYLTGWWRGLAVLESLGQHVWRRIQPLGQRLLPVDNPGKAFFAGMVWGWLPCGLVYSALIIAMTSGDPAHAALLMLAFGLGTLPVMLAIGMAAVQLQRFRAHSLVRTGAGIFMMLTGVALMIGLIDLGALHMQASGGGHAHHH